MNIMNLILEQPLKEYMMELIVSSQNRWPSLSFDIGSINNFLSPIFSAGFYYKTFMGPKGFWKKFMNH